MKSKKNYRILCLYVWLAGGKCINIHCVASEFHVDTRTIQRDIADIRAFLAEEMVSTGLCRQVIYDKSQNGYRLGVC